MVNQRSLSLGNISGPCAMGKAAPQVRKLAHKFYRWNNCNAHKGTIKQMNILHYVTFITLFNYFTKEQKVIIIIRFRIFSLWMKKTLLWKTVNLPMSLLAIFYHVFLIHKKENTWLVFKLIKCQGYFISTSFERCKTKALIRFRKIWSKLSLSMNVMKMILFSYSIQPY